MAGYLTRCRRCRQPILSDARCCPHCAVAKPRRGRRARNALLAALAIAAATLGAYQLSLSVAGRLSRPPDRFAAACLERGGTVVQVRGPDGSVAERCAIRFDDDIPR